MIRSMTGYGSATLEFGSRSLRAETRSVNSRHLKVVLRAPTQVEAWESEIRDQVNGDVRRGRVELWISTEAGVSETGLVLDEARITAQLEALREAKTRFGLDGDVDLRLVAQLGGLVREAQKESPDWIELEQALAVTREVIAALVEMREKEGARLEIDLRARVAALRDGANAVEGLAPERLERERDRLRAAVRDLSDGLDLDADRVAREIAVIADKWDIGEELVRARAHLDAFDEYLEAPGEEPVGKRLGFLVQELHREVNTMGAKANDTRISRHVVEMKNEIEKLREQVENVE